jgi:predicted nucleic acid-binding protein
MDRLFLDANVLFSAAYKADARVFRLWGLSDVLLCSSRYALEEARFNLADQNQLHRLASLTERVQFYEAGKRNLPRSVHLPDKDAPILLAAIEAKSNFLLTGDFRHFGPYFDKRIEGVTVIRPSQYLKIRNQS